MTDDMREVASRALACLDLTNLNDDCTEEDVLALCDRASTPVGPTAAVCVWPKFVSAANARLTGTGIRIATVVNFPTGMETTEAVVEMARQALVDGADEIDLVVPYPVLMEGRQDAILHRVARIKEAIGSVTLKTILETGILGEPELVRQAAREALAGGADFLKTSTGKVAVNATLTAARILLEEIAAQDRPVGFKPAGGIRTTAEAAAYLNLADEIMGEGWAKPTTFRIGASGVLTDLLATLGASEAPEEQTQTQEGY